MEREIKCYPITKRAKTLIKRTVRESHTKILKTDTSPPPYTSDIDALMDRRTSPEPGKILNCRRRSDLQHQLRETAHFARRSACHPRRIGGRSYKITVPGLNTQIRTQKVGRNSTGRRKSRLSIMGQLHLMLINILFIPQTMFLQNNQLTETLRNGLPSRAGPFAPTSLQSLM
jgi:hypothetical protein